MFRVFYGRKSRLLGDPEDLDVFSHQLNPLIRRAEAEGRPVAPEEIVVEVGSSETIEERPRFKQLLEEIEELRPASGGELWVADVDRLSRGTLTQRGRIVEALCRAGVLLRTASRTLDLTDADDLFWYEFSSGRGANEMGRFKARVEARRRELVLAGQLRTGRPCWGYVWSKDPRPGTRDRRGHLQPDPDRFPILVRLCREALTDSTVTLANRYAHAGLYQVLVWMTLRNPILCGWWPQRYRRGIDHPLPREEWIWPEQPGDWEPACSREHWEAIQIALDQRRDERSKRGGDAGWCRDVLRFAGRPERVRLGSRPPVPHYELVVASQAKLYIPRSTVHDAALKALAGLLTRPVGLAEALEQYQRRPAFKGPENGSSAEEVRQRLATLIAEQDRLQLLELRAEDEERRDSWRRLARQTAAEVRELRTLLQPALHPVETRMPLTEIAATLDEVGRSLPEYWQTLSDSERRPVVRAIIRRIEATITPGSGNRDWRREVTAVEWQPWVVADR